MNVGDIVRVEAGNGAIEGEVISITPMGEYNMVHIETGWRAELVSDDLYDIQILRVAVPPEPTELGAVWTQGDHTYVRFGADSRVYSWIDTATAATYTWEQIHERGGSRG